MSEKIGVVLLNLGGPDSLDAVEPFLFNLFSDPDIIDFPGSFLFRKRLAKLISTRRSPGVIKQYEEIGGKSPLKDYTLQQASLLERKAERADCRRKCMWRCVTGSRLPRKLWTRSSATVSKE